MIWSRICGLCAFLLVGTFVPTGQSIDLAGLGLDKLNLGGLGLDQLNLPNMNKAAGGAEAMMGWLEKLTNQCKANNVKIDMAFMLQRYMCLTTMKSSLVSGDPVNDAYFGKICKEWPQAKKCVNPLLNKLELCFSGNGVNLDGVVTKGLDAILSVLCKHDIAALTSLMSDGPLVADCIQKKTDKLVPFVTTCFGFTRTPTKAEICSDFDVYKNCIIKSTKICDDPKVEKIVHTMIEEVGFKDIIYSSILQCGETEPKKIEKSDTKKKEKSEKKKEEKADKEKKEKKSKKSSTNDEL